MVTGGGPSYGPLLEMDSDQVRDSDERTMLQRDADVVREQQFVERAQSIRW